MAKLFLCGGGSGEQVKEAYRVFQAVIDHTKPMLYIPLAMPEDLHTLDECYAWIQSEMKEAGVDVPSIEMVRSYEEIMTKELTDYCAIFIGGGNTFSLLKGLKESGAIARIEEYLRNDGIVFGGSAGAILFGRDIMPAIAMDPNDVALQETAGFDSLGGVSVFAHYTNEWTEEAHVRFTEFLTKYSAEKEPVYALPEEDTLLIDGDRIQIIGSRPYYIFEKGTRQKKRAEIRLDLTDEEWPMTYTDHDRRIARGIVFDDEGYFYFVRAERDDDFGRATLIETAGGGVEEGEVPDTGVHRELKEELGVEVEVVCRIGLVSDYYNLIHRHNLNHYYLCRITSFGEKHLTQDEIEDFHLSTLKMTYEEALAEYGKRRTTKIGRLVGNREVPILMRAREILDAAN